MNFSTLTGRKCKPSMQSVNGGRGGGGGGPNARPPAGTSEAQFRLSQPCKGPGPDWVAFSDLTQGRNSFMMNDTSAVDPLVVVLLCARSSFIICTSTCEERTGAFIQFDTQTT